MHTTCPECRTTFRVSPAQLDARRGLVRCGYCQAVFNAYDTLVPDAEAPAATPAESPDEASPAWDIPPPSLPESLKRERPEAEHDFSSEHDQADAEAADDDYILHLGAEDDKVPSPPPADSTDAILLSDLPTRERRAGASKVPWVLLNVALLLVLLGQSAYFLRGSLVAWLPELRPQLESACKTLGCRIPLASEVEALRIEASSLETDPEQPNRATLRVSISNRSRQAQQWPYLVLKLTDWRGIALAQRAFKPEEYLGKGATIAGGVAPMSEQEFRLDLDLTGLSASGYEVVAKYR